MLTEPGKFYRVRYSFDKGGAYLKQVADAFKASGHVVESIEDHGDDLPGWMTAVFQAVTPVDYSPGQTFSDGTVIVAIEEEPLGVITDWPGLKTVAREDLIALKEAIPPTWDFNSLLGHISSESPRFELNTKNPFSSARGLIQMIAGNRAKYHAEDLSTFRAQIPGIVAYFKDASKPVLVGSDFKVAGFSQRSVHKPDSTVIFPAGSEEAKGHKAFLDAQGNFTVGSVRKWWDWWSTEGYKTKGGKPRVSKKAASVALGFVAAGALGLIVLLGLRKRR